MLSTVRTFIGDTHTHTKLGVGLPISLLLFNKHNNMMFKKMTQKPISEQGFGGWEKEHL